jgi:hypothetical protein
MCIYRRNKFHWIKLNLCLEISTHLFFFMLLTLSKIQLKLLTLGPLLTLMHQEVFLFSNVQQCCMPFYPWSHTHQNSTHTHLQYCTEKLIGNLKHLRKQVSCLCLLSNTLRKVPCLHSLPRNHLWNIGHLCFFPLYGHVSIVVKR